MADGMVVTNDLCKTFKGRKAVVEAVKNVNLCVKQGEIFGFLGPNGAGKTTTMRMLTTLMVPTAGSATIVGYDLKKEAKKIREQIGYVSQKGGCYEFATGLENLVLQGRLYGQSGDAARKNAERLVNIFGMGDFIRRKVITYSGGQRRHVDLAMGVMHDPRLLFLDEPTTGLDPASRTLFWNEIRNLREKGITIFLTTHYMDEADSLCDTVCIMDRGTVVAMGSASDLKRRISGDIIEIGMDPCLLEKAKALLSARKGVHEILTGERSLKIYIDAGEKALPKLLPFLAEEGVTVTSVKMSRASLDEVFLKMTGHSIQNGSEKEVGS